MNRIWSDPKISCSILSDMQFNAANHDDIETKTIYEIIEQLFIEAGVKVCGKPYRAPRIILWGGPQANQWGINNDK